MEQTKNGSGFEAGGHVGIRQPDNQVVSASVDVPPYQGGQYSASGPPPPQPPSSASAAAGTVPGYHTHMRQNPPPVQNFHRERERDRIPTGHPGQLQTPPGLPVINSIQQRFGEWDCPGCNAHNYANRVDCFKCGKKKPLDVKDQRPGDWYCLGCSAHNYSTRDQCFRCQKGKPTGTETVTYNGNRRPGD